MSNKCTYNNTPKQPDPHSHEKLYVIVFFFLVLSLNLLKYNSFELYLISQVGHTPLVRLSRLAQAEGIECELRKSYFAVDIPRN